MIQKVSLLPDKLGRRLVKLSDLNPPNELISPAQSPIHARASQPPQKPPFPARITLPEIHPKSAPLPPPKSTPVSPPSELGPKPPQNPGLQPPSQPGLPSVIAPGSPWTPVLIIRGLKTCALIIQRVRLKGRDRAAPSDVPRPTERAGPSPDHRAPPADAHTLLANLRRAPPSLFAPALASHEWRAPMSLQTHHLAEHQHGQSGPGRVRSRGIRRAESGQLWQGHSEHGQSAGQEHRQPSQSVRGQRPKSAQLWQGHEA